MSNDSFQANPPHPNPLPKGEGTGTRPKKRSRLKKVILALLVLLIAAYFTYTPIISSIIGVALHNMLESRLHAALQYDSITYVFPRQVRLNNARITTDASLGQIDLFTCEKLELQLAVIPWPKSPLVIQSLELQSPALHVVKTATGIVGAKGLHKSDEEQRLHPPLHRLSEMFELRKFTIADGKVVYEDRTIAGIEPLVFRNINADLGVTPQSRGVYGYHFQSAQPPLVTLEASGTADIDAAMVELAKLSSTVECKRVDGESSLPPKLQKIVNELGISGKLNVDGHGEFPVRGLSKMKFWADGNLSDGRATQVKLDQLDMQMHFEQQDGRTQVQFSKIHANSFGGQVDATGSIAANPTKYEAQIDASGLDLSQIATLGALESKSVKLTGEGRISAKISGESWGLDHLTGDGDAQITKAKFPESKTISGIAQRAGIAPESLTTGDAAAVFSVRERALTISKGAINTQVLGLQGSGSMSFDGNLNFDIIAAPLGDWRNHVEKMNIPLVGGVASSVAGRMQNLVSATSKLLYHFEVTGKISDPQIRPIPAPALTDKAATVFGRMTQGGSDLLKAVKE